MEHLNSGYLQLGLFALAFGGFQVWWISSTLRKHAKPALNRLPSKGLCNIRNNMKIYPKYYMFYFK